MLNRNVYLDEIERIMDIRCTRGKWCYYAATVKGGFQIAVCGEDEVKNRLLEGELFFSKNLVNSENCAHELNRTRLEMTPDISGVIVAKFLARSAFGG